MDVWFCPSYNASHIIDTGGQPVSGKSIKELPRKSCYHIPRIAEIHRDLLHRVNLFKSRNIICSPWSQNCLIWTLSYLITHTAVVCILFTGVLSHDIHHIPASRFGGMEGIRSLIALCVWLQNYILSDAALYTNIVISQELAFQPPYIEKIFHSRVVPEPIIMCSDGIILPGFLGRRYRCFYIRLWGSFSNNISKSALQTLLCGWVNQGVSVCSSAKHWYLTTKHWNLMPESPDAKFP